jgi:hypothetical protein
MEDHIFNFGKLFDFIYQQGLSHGTNPEWQPIETAPKEFGKRILLYQYFDSAEVFVGCWAPYFDGCWYVPIIGHLNGKLKPTHWMPLPEAPEKQNELNNHREGLE